MNGLIKFQRGRELRDLQREFDRLFDSFLPQSSVSESDLGNWSPRADIQESESAYTLELDIPGMSRDNININFHDGVLSISGEREFEKTEDDSKLYRYERQFGKFLRSFALGKSVDADKITATYADGVLTVDVPKTEESKPRRITVG